MLFQVLEETGFDISNHVRSDDFIEIPIRGRPMRLYIVIGVAETTVFRPKCEFEISKVQWYSIQELLGENKGTYRHFLVTPFLT